MHNIPVTAMAAVLLALVSGGTGGHSPAKPEFGVISQGEDLLYEVSWTIFKLGTIRLKTLQTTVEDDMRLHRAAAFIDSYEGLPFVNLHSIAHTEMDSALSSRGGSSLEERKSGWWGIYYRYDSTRSRCFVEETWQTDLKSAPYKRTNLDTLYIKGSHVQDGLSVVYFARGHVHDRRTLTVPTIAYGKLGSTTFRFTGTPGTQEIDALDRPIRVVELDGWLDVEGIFGLTGEFKGWFSDDSLALPIKAELKVILGSVKVELIQWHRKGWNPPS